MRRFSRRLRAGLALRLPNLWRVSASAYRLQVKLEINPVGRIRAHIPDGDFFGTIPARTAAESPGGYDGCSLAAVLPRARRYVGPTGLLRLVPD